MRETVGDYIDRNINEIRNLTAQGKNFEGSLDVGRKTGEGWVTTEAGDLSRAALWDDNLQGFKIIIGPRKGYAYTATDPEGWFVLTAYPDRI